MREVRYRVDTNVLLRTVKRDHPQYPTVRRALDVLHDRGIAMGYTLQNMTEFWNVSTRPADRNGFGLSVEETELNVREIEDGLVMFEDNEAVYREWRRLVVQ